MKKTELSGMTVVELRSLAKSKKIPLPAAAKKADIIKALERTGARTSRRTGGEAVKKTGSIKTTKAKGKAKTTTKAQGKAATKGQKGTAKAKAPARTPSPRKATARKAPAGKRTHKAAGGMVAADLLAAQEQVESAKYFTGAAGMRRQDPTSLSAEYGEERVVLLARDPDTVYCYWEVPRKRLDRERARFGKDGRLAIRVYDVTGVQFDGSNATSFFDQVVSERVGSWYFTLKRPGHAFCADIGILSSSGRFREIVRSSVLRTPPGTISEVVDEEWSLPEHAERAIYGIPAGAPGGASSEQVRELLRLWRGGEITSPGVSSWITQRPGGK